MKEATYRIVGIRKDGSRITRTYEGLKAAQRTKRWMLRNHHNDALGGPRKVVKVYWNKLTNPERDVVNEREYAEAMV